jgi:hypothetical protein
VGAWGPGIYQNDDALDLRDRWRDLLGAGFDAKDVGRRLIGELDLKDDADHSQSWLALADLLWRSGRLASDVRRRALRIIRDGVDLQRWDDARRRARERALEQLEQRLLSPMPSPRPIRPRHPCDWKRGEHIVWRMADGGSAVLRVVSFDPRWGGGGSPVCELVDSGGPGYRPALVDIMNANARPVAHGLDLTSGRRWKGARFKIGVLEPETYSALRVHRMKPPSPARRFPATKVEAIGTRWNGLDGFLFRGFDLPWPRGSILRVASNGPPIWLVVVDVTTRSKLPAIVCEVLDWHQKADPSPTILRGLDTHRTGDTVSIVRARIVDPRNRQSVAKMKRHLGVRNVDERAPFRVTLLGFCPTNATVVGRRRVTVPVSSSNVVEWTDLETVLSRLVEGGGPVAMDDVDRAPWG